MERTIERHVSESGMKSVRESLFSRGRVTVPVRCPATAADRAELAIERRSEAEQDRDMIKHKLP